MSEPTRPRIGSISWADLTVAAAPAVRDFYRRVTGWEFSEVEMGGYVDYCMNLPGGGEPIAGICHARGANANLPPQWLVYINVMDLDQSIAECLAGGGAVIAGPRSMGKQGRFCVIRDPAGAAAALFEAAP
jgi:predicted enzyme related to lactoylglutathione lyase